MSESGVKQTRSEQRDAARETSRLRREAEKRRAKMKRVAIQGTVALALVGLTAGAFAIWNTSNQPAGPGPENMQSGGVIFDSLSTVVASDPQPAGSEERPAPVFDEDKVGVSVYMDYMCPGCGSFEQQYSELLGALVDEQRVELHIVPVTFLDPTSGGMMYSSRAANLLGCLTSLQPEAALATHNALLQAGTQPAEGSAGLKDKELLQVAVGAGAANTGELRSCITGRPFTGFFQQGSALFSETAGLSGLAEGELLLAPGGAGLQPEGKQMLTTTPTVIVDGVQWQRAEDFAEFLEAAVNAKFGNS